ncbi:MAG: hypothetical protein IJR85_02230 [Synergistaceae bacterium]|nr:hypothetical protein [Synergistaceae bacterium]
MMIGSMNTINMTYKALTATNNALEKTARALSTGLKAAHVSDDASGSAISTNISAQVASVDRAVRNAQDGISLLQTAEGGLSQINAMLQRMRELSVQAANDTLTVQDRGYIQMEINELRANINNVANNTTFNSKRLLDGSSAATWSSDNANTKLIADGALTQIDQFGQKKHMEGNYRIEIKAKAGQGQVQKSSIFTIGKIEDKSEWDGYDYEININTGQDTSTGKTSGIGWEFYDGVLTITRGGRFSIVGDTTATTNRVVIKEGADSKVKLTNVNITPDNGSAFQITGSNVKVFLEGENVLTGGAPEQSGLEVRNSLNNGPKGSVEINSIAGFGSTEGKLTATGAGDGAGIGGSCHFPEANVGYSVGEITINGGTIIANGSWAGAGIGGGGEFMLHPDAEVGPHVRITINGGDITATAGDRGGAGIGSGTDCINDSRSVDFITINGGKIKATAYGGGAAIGGGKDSNSGVIRINRNAELELEGWIDEENGQTQPIGRGMNGVRTGKEYDNVTYTSTSTDRYATLEDIPEFYNYDGVFLVKEPQKITISQGNGKSTDVILYSKDTIEDVRRKFNDAIAFGLGQSAYADNLDEFVSFVYPGGNDTQGSESVEGTFVVRSAVAGSAGKLTFASENQDLMNTFGFNTIQEAEDNTFTASVYDAHTGRVLASNIDTEGNTINGVLGANTSIEFDSMANVKASWDEGSKRYVLSSEAKVYTTTLHVQDRSTSFQIGQAEGQDIYLNIGDMRSEALGIEKVNVMTRENASKSITLLDAAIHKVGVQRSRIGAYQNELEYNMNSLTQTGLHLQESESRIKDADMAKEYMEFVKFQILNQTGTSMLSNSSQNARSVMNILTV